MVPIYARVLMVTFFWVPRQKIRRGTHLICHRGPRKPCKSNKWAHAIAWASHLFSGCIWNFLGFYDGGQADAKNILTPQNNKFNNQCEKQKQSRSGSVPGFRRDPGTLLRGMNQSFGGRIYSRHLFKTLGLFIFSPRLESRKENPITKGGLPTISPGSDALNMELR